jgi:cysteine desulfurase/selenocysteine lyase
LPDGLVDRVAAREFPGPSGGIHLNAASWGLVPISAARESAELMLRRNRADGFSEADFGPIQRRCRAALASLLDVDRDEIVLCPNTTYGVGLAVALVGAGPPGTIVVSRGEFPANVLPWMALERLGFRLRFVDVDAGGLPDESALIQALAGPDVRALALSAVQFATGYRHDLAALGGVCGERGVLFCVDAIQALGAVPLSPRRLGIDLLASGGQKWLCSAWGSGFAWVDRSLHERFDPPLASWLGVRGGAKLHGTAEYALDWVVGARRFEVATLGYQDYLTLARSTEVLLEMGIERVERHLHRLHGSVLDWIASRRDVHPVTPLNPRRRAGILSFRHPRTDAASGALAAAGVVHSVRGGLIRLAPHYYNTVAEMEEVVRLLDSAAGVASVP